MIFLPKLSGSTLWPLKIEIEILHLFCEVMLGLSSQKLILNNAKSISEIAEGNEAYIVTYELSIYVIFSHYIKVAVL